MPSAVSMRAVSPVCSRRCKEYVVLYNSIKSNRSSKYRATLLIDCKGVTVVGHVSYDAWFSEFTT